MRVRPGQMIAVVALAGSLMSAFGAEPSSSIRDLDTTGEAIPSGPKDEAIARALRQISPKQIRHTIETLVSFHTRSTLSSMEHLPKGQGINAAANWIESELKKYSQACQGCLEVKRDTFTQSPAERVPRPTTITNVYAVLRGSDPARAQYMYLVTGHYDSRNSDTLDARGEAPGANDDASGVAVSLECARVLSQLRPAATIVFVAVAGEEQGLDGSRHLAKLAKEQGWQLLGVLNNDIVGGNTTPGDRLQDKSVVRVYSEGIPALATAEQAKQLETLGYAGDSASRELARAIVESAATYEGDLASGDSVTGGELYPLLEFRRDRFLRGGDHTAFNQEGFAGVRFTEWREDFNHQHQNVRTEDGIEYGDLLKFVDFEYVARVAAVNAAALATLASAPPPPGNVRLLTKQLDNSTSLEWEGAPGNDTDAHYEIVWRALSSPTWQRFIASKSTSAVVEVSKDNVIFGVRSVDSKGHRSIAVAPMPVR
ncbi:MAG TPA: M28 family metallopeptidase [Steroidobacteraceae bacterium]|nr:M28 family metallopeptidase [Steroidobacteraceae bacterium]